VQGVRIRRWHVRLVEDQGAAALSAARRRERDAVARGHSFDTLFERGSGALSAQLRVALCGVDDPLNVGLVMRLLSCFGAGALRHLSYESGGDAGWWGEQHGRPAA
jgi:tRNA G18 (ribose-2'-O)-methylase SpoU